MTTSFKSYILGIAMLSTGTLALPTSDICEQQDLLQEIQQDFQVRLTLQLEELMQSTQQHLREASKLIITSID
ncbi:MAG: hypothetical protein JJU10_03945 [Idiomarina sp.]|nr:hypothetical protein [Idiomarina sp.]